MELNREQIIKALECCYGDSECPLCPFYMGEDRGCYVDLGTSALSLIKELTEENEGMANICNANDALIAKLQKENKELIINMNAFGLTAKRLGEENERLNEENYRLHCDVWLNVKDEVIAQVKSDTVRKMLQRIKEDAIAVSLLSNPPKFMLEIREDALDQIAKEMLEGKE